MLIEECCGYLNGLTRFVFERDHFVLIAHRENLLRFGSIGDIDEATEDRCKIRLYELVLRGPNMTAMSSMQHGNFRQDVGSEQLSPRVLQGVREELNRLYRKYGMTEKLWSENGRGGGGLSFVDEGMYA